MLVVSLSFSAVAQAQDRMPPIPPEKMSEAQKKAAAESSAARGPLTGPWNVLLRSPELVNRQRGAERLRAVQQRLVTPVCRSSSFSSRHVIGRSGTSGTHTTRSR